MSKLYAVGPPNTIAEYSAFLHTWGITNGMIAKINSEQKAIAVYLYIEEEQFDVAKANSKFVEAFTQFERLVNFNEHMKETEASLENELSVQDDTISHLCDIIDTYESYIDDNCDSDSETD